MELQNILTEIDSEIARLQHARSVLFSLNGNPGIGRKVGRPKGSGTSVREESNGTHAAKHAAPLAPAREPAKPVRTSGMSPEGRAKIAEAMRRRWAEKRSAKPAKKTSAKASAKGAGVKAAGATVRLQVHIGPQIGPLTFSSGYGTREKPT
jgi:hypothetical protein